MADLFANAPEKTKRSWLRLLASVGAHVGAGAVAPGVGNAGVRLAEAAGGAMAASKAAQAEAMALAEKIRIARSPEEAAAALDALTTMAKSDPGISDFLQRNGIPIGALGAAATQ